MSARVIDMPSKKDRICKHCDRQFRARRASDVRQFCSTKCHGLSKRTLQPVVSRDCSVCGVQFIPFRQNRDSVFCGRSCAWRATKGSAFNAKIARESAEKRGALQRGRGEGKSYRKLNGRHEHRVVAEQKLGRALLPDEVVHHIDGNKLNNDPSNLEVMTQRHHMLEHGLGVPGQLPANHARRKAGL